jgi:hypothetical protein
MIVLAYLGSSVHNFTQLGGRADFLRPFIWPDAISRCIQQRDCNKVCATLGKSATETLAMIRQAFGEEIMSRTRKVQNHGDRKC